MLSVGGLTKYYGKFAALRDVSFQIQEGSTALLLGPNGAGKTTIIKCIMGLLNFKGQIALDGLEVRAKGTDVREKIGYVPQQTSYYENLSILDQAAFVSKLKRANPGEIQSRLEMVELWGFRTRQVKSLSSGMRQRLGIALALLKDPPFLIFDEPTSNIDLKGQLEFQTLLSQFSEQKKTMLIATHLSGLDQYADNAIVLNSGRVIAYGPPKQLLAKIKAMDKVYLKVSREDMGRAAVVLRDGGVDGVTTEGDWLMFSTFQDRKAVLLSSLTEKGFAIQDVIIEPTRIESGYLKFMEEGRN